MTNETVKSALLIAARSALVNDKPAHLVLEIDGKTRYLTIYETNEERVHDPIAHEIIKLNENEYEIGPAATSIWFLAQTEHLLTVEIDRDPYTDKNAVITVGGEIAKIKGHQGVKRFRDGGTTTIETDKGTITVPAKRRQDQGDKPSIDGEWLYQLRKI